MKSWIVIRKEEFRCTSSLFPYCTCKASPAKGAKAKHIHAYYSLALTSSIPSFHSVAIDQSECTNRAALLLSSCHRVPAGSSEPAANCRPPERSVSLRPAHLSTRTAVKSNAPGVCLCVSISVNLLNNDGTCASGWFACPTSSAG